MLKKINSYVNKKKELNDEYFDKVYKLVENIYI